jgi:DNA-binding Xre family transcriptional regulator
VAPQLASVLVCVGLGSFALGMSRRSGMTDEQVRVVHGAYLRGERSLREGAEAIGFSRATAQRRVRELGLEMRPARSVRGRGRAGSPAQAEQQVITERLVERIEVLRVSRGLSVVGLARVSGLSLATVQNVRARLQDPRLTTVLKLCRGLGVAPGELLDDLSLPVEPRRRRAPVRRDGA